MKIAMERNDLRNVSAGLLQNHVRENWLDRPNIIEDNNDHEASNCQKELEKFII
jgi:hypothetical protein